MIRTEDLYVRNITNKAPREKELGLENGVYIFVRGRDDFAYKVDPEVLKVKPRLIIAKKQAQEAFISGKSATTPSMEEMQRMSKMELLKLAIGYELDVNERMPNTEIIEKIMGHIGADK